MKRNIVQKFLLILMLQTSYACADGAQPDHAQAQTTPPPPPPKPTSPSIWNRKLSMSSSFARDLGTKKHLMLIRTCYRVKAYLRRFMIECDLMSINHEFLFSEFNRIFDTIDPDSNGKIIKFNVYTIAVFMLTFVETLKMGLANDVVDYNLIKMARICNKLIDKYGKKMPAFNSSTIVMVCNLFIF
jgi:hypothetical protein